MATLKQRLRRKNSSGSYDTIYLQTDLSNVTGTLQIANGGTGQTSIANIKTSLSLPSDTSGEINNLKTSVGSGKQLIAAAVTDKGVPTAADDTFQTMASNIRSISADAITFLRIHYTEGAICTCTGPGTSYTAPDTSGTAIFRIYTAGDYNIRLEKDSRVSNTTISVTGELLIQEETVFLIVPIPIDGICLAYKGGIGAGITTTSTWRADVDQWRRTNALYSYSPICSGVKFSASSTSFIVEAANFPDGVTPSQIGNMVIDDNIVIAQFTPTASLQNIVGAINNSVIDDKTHTISVGGTFSSTMLFKSAYFDI